MKTTAMIIMSILFLMFISGCVRNYKLNVNQYSYACDGQEDYQEISTFEEEVSKDESLNKDGQKISSEKRKTIYHGRNVVSVYVDASVPKEITSEGSLQLKASPLP